MLVMMVVVLVVLLLLLLLLLVHHQEEDITKEMTKEKLFLVERSLTHHHVCATAFSNRL